MEDAQSYALSDDDINFTLEPDTTIQRYHILDTLKHIDDIFDTSTSLGKHLKNIYDIKLVI